MESDRSCRAASGYGSSSRNRRSVAWEAYWPLCWFGLKNSTRRIIKQGKMRDVASGQCPFVRNQPQYIMANYSERSARIGSMEAARQAGAMDAAMTRSSTAAIARLRTVGSDGLTSNRSELSNWEAANAPINPRMHPASPSLAADTNTSLKIPVRCEPNAIRIAISWLRRAKVKAITL